MTARFRVIDGGGVPHQSARERLLRRERFNLVDSALDGVPAALHKNDPAKAKEILNSVSKFIDMMWPPGGKP